jgi:hypothetical protein
MLRILDANRAQEMIREKASTITDPIDNPPARILDAIEQGKTVEIARAIDTVISQSPRPRCVYLHSTRDVDGSIEQAARHLAARLVATKAAFRLLNECQLLPMDVPAKLPALRINWDTAPEGSGGHSGYWDFQETTICLPHLVRLAY